MRSYRTQESVTHGLRRAFAQRRDGRPWLNAELDDPLLQATTYARRPLSDSLAWFHVLEEPGRWGWHLGQLHVVDSDFGLDGIAVSLATVHPEEAGSALCWRFDGPHREPRGSGCERCTEFLREKTS